MLKPALASAVALALFAGVPASAQERPIKASASAKVLLTEGHVDSLRQALQLRPEQEPLWSAVEAALHEYIRAQDASIAPASAQKLVSKTSAAYQQAASLGRIILAARPLVATLTPEQKQAALGVAQSAGLSHLAAAL